MQATSHVLPLAIEKNSRYQIFPELIWNICIFGKSFLLIYLPTHSHILLNKELKKKKRYYYKFKDSKSQLAKNYF